MPSLNLQATLGCVPSQSGYYLSLPKPGECARWAVTPLLIGLPWPSSEMGFRLFPFVLFCYLTHIYIRSYAQRRPVYIYIYIYLCSYVPPPENETTPQSGQRTTRQRGNIRMLKPRKCRAGDKALFMINQMATFFGPSVTASNVGKHSATRPETGKLISLKLV